MACVGSLLGLVVDATTSAGLVPFDAAATSQGPAKLDVPEVGQRYQVPSGVADASATKSFGDDAKLAEGDTASLLVVAADVAAAGRAVPAALLAVSALAGQPIGSQALVP